MFVSGTGGTVSVMLHTWFLASHSNFLVSLSYFPSPPSVSCQVSFYCNIFSSDCFPFKRNSRKWIPSLFPARIRTSVPVAFPHILRLVKLLDLYLFPSETPRPLCRFTMTSCVRLSSSLLCWFVSAQQKLPRGKGNQQWCAHSCKTVSNNRKLINRENPSSSHNMQQAMRWGKTRCV